MTHGEGDATMNLITVWISVGVRGRLNSMLQILAPLHMWQEPTRLQKGTHRGTHKTTRWGDQASRIQLVSCVYA